MSNIVYYIIVHDIKIVNHFEKIGKYKPLKNYKYILVGDQLEDHSRDNVVQANLLDNNIEHWKNYLAYTGWWAVGKNLLDEIEEDYIFFLEYDSDLLEDNLFREMEDNIINSDSDIFAISSLPTSVCFVNKNDEWVKLTGYDHAEWWMVSNNICFRKDKFKQFIDDPILLDVFNILDNGVGTGHALERYTTLYFSSKGIKYDLISPVCITHDAFDSHNTQGMFHKFKNFIDSI